MTFDLDVIYLMFQVVDGKCFAWAFWPSKLFNRALGVFIIFIQFILPLIILMYCYGRIIWVLTRRIDSNIMAIEKGTNPENKIEDQIRDKFQFARTNTIKTFLWVGLFLIICWSNDQISYLMYNLGYDIDFNSTHWKFSTLMAFVNCTVNPFIYLIKYRDYQEALRELFGCQKKKNIEETYRSKDERTFETTM